MSVRNNRSKFRKSEDLVGLNMGCLDLNNSGKEMKDCEYSKAEISK